MSLDSGKLMYSEGNNDECYTPYYAVIPILKYIPKDAIVSVSYTHLTLPTTPYV